MVMPRSLLLVWTTLCFGCLLVQICSSFIVVDRRSLRQITPPNFSLEKQDHLQVAAVHTSSQSDHDFVQIREQHIQSSPSSSSSSSSSSSMLLRWCSIRFLKIMMIRFTQKIKYVFGILALSLALWGGPCVNHAGAVITLLPGTGVKTAITKPTTDRTPTATVSKQSKKPVQKKEVKKKSSISPRKEKKKMSTKISTKRVKKVETKTVTQTTEGRESFFKEPRLETPSMKNRPSTTFTYPPSKPIVPKPTKKVVPKRKEGKTVATSKVGNEDSRVVSTVPSPATFVVVTGSGVILGLATNEGVVTMGKKLIRGQINSDTEEENLASDESPKEVGEDDKMGAIEFVKSQLIQLFKKIASVVSEQRLRVKKILAKEWERSGEVGNVGNVAGKVAAKLSQRSQALKQVLSEEWKRSGEEVGVNDSQ